MAEVDMELKKAFTDMQVSKIETDRQISMIDMKYQMVNAGKHKYQLTRAGTSDLTDDTKVYTSVGRMFVQSDVTKMRAELLDKMDKCDKAADLLSKKKKFLQNALKEQEDGLRELVQQRKGGEAKKEIDKKSDEKTDKKAEAEQAEKKTEEKTDAGKEAEKAAE